MFNFLLTLMLGILIGWNIHALSIQAKTPQFIQEKINLENIQAQLNSPTCSEISKKKLIVKVFPKIEKDFNFSTTIQTTKIEEKSDSFYSLLRKNLFSDALTVYMDSSMDKIEHYRVALSSFFKENMKEKPKETMVQLIEYLDIEPENEVSQLQLINLYIQEKKYKKAITHLSELIENSDENKAETLNGTLITVSEFYIQELIQAKNFRQLLTFLEERINFGIHPTFYKYSLAKYYIEMKNYEKAQELLNDIAFNEVYQEKISLLQKKIDNNIDEDQLYQYKIPLFKDGSHYTIKASVNNIPVLLLLDTGATVTTIDASKITSLKVINENVTLYTAGGVVYSQLKEAESFTIGDEIKFNNFKIISNLYPSDSTDGLLGMNFFKKFKFKIDQEEQILYLSKKKTLKI